MTNLRFASLHGLPVVPVILTPPPIPLLKPRARYERASQCAAISGRLSSAVRRRDVALRLRFQTLLSASALLAQIPILLVSESQPSLVVFISPFFRVLDRRHSNFQNDWLTFRDELLLAAWQLGEQRQFQPLHDRFNPPQMMAANGNLVRREDELEVLLVATTVEFRKDEMIVRQQ